LINLVPSRGGELLLLDDHQTLRRGRHSQFDLAGGATKGGSFKSYTPEWDQASHTGPRPRFRVPDENRNYRQANREDGGKNLYITTEGNSRARQGDPTTRGLLISRKKVRQNDSQVKKVRRGVVDFSSIRKAVTGWGVTSR